MNGLLSKKYAASRAALISPFHNDNFIKPGDPYPFQGEKNPYEDLLNQWTNTPDPDGELMPPGRWPRSTSRDLSALQISAPRPFRLPINQAGLSR